MEKKKPFERDFLNEAFQIATGNTKIKTKKEHVMALFTTLNSLSQRQQRLAEKMAEFAKVENERRKKQGLPEVGKPPGIDYEQ